MKIKNRFITCLLVLMAFCCCRNIVAQRNFYHRVDVGSSNIYTFVYSNLITGYANYLTHDFLCDNSLSYTFYDGRYNGADVKTRYYSMMNLTAEDLFHDCFAGLKLGYQSDNMSSLNWGVYGSAHYKINQFQAMFPFMADYKKECVQYIKPGIGAFLTFGGVESRSKFKVQIEAAIRYDKPIGYKGVFGDKTKELNDGISSHFAVKIAGFTEFSAGLYADFNHYDLYKGLKDVGQKSKFKIYSIGVTFTITPKRGEDLYD